MENLNWEWNSQVLFLRKSQRNFLQIAEVNFNLNPNENAETDSKNDQTVYLERRMGKNSWGVVHIMYTYSEGLRKTRKCLYEVNGLKLFILIV